MKTLKFISLFIIACFILTSCSSEKKQVLKTASISINKQQVSLAISGMTCEVGCAKTIQSKLSKKEGVLTANVIFKDSLANIEFNANATSKKDLVAFVDAIAGGNLYKASVSSKKEKKE